MKGSLRSVFAEVRWWAKPQDLTIEKRAQRKTRARDGRRMAKTAPQAWFTTARSANGGCTKKRGEPKPASSPRKLITELSRWGSLNHVAFSLAII